MLRRRMMMAQGETALEYGCYIQDTTGKLWEAGTWDGSATANGIAVYQEEASFVMALEYKKYTMIMEDPTTLPSLKSDTTAALADYDGLGNTRILNSGGWSNALNYCINFRFPAIIAETYIPSAGEMNVVYNHLSEIQGLMDECGGVELVYVALWTSSLRSYATSYQNFWRVYMSSSLGLASARSTNSYYVIPFGVWSPEDEIVLPQGYTRLGYLDSGGGNYIDTGVIPNATTRVVLDYQLLSNPMSSEAAFGCMVSGDYQFWVYYSALADAWEFRRTASEVTTYKIYLTATERCTIDVSGNVMTIGDESVTATAEAFTSSLSMYIFALNNSGVSQNPAEARCYGCKIYDNGTLIRDYIPAMDSEGEEGLYDIVNDVWYAFVVGNPI